MDDLGPFAVAIALVVGLLGLAWWAVDADSREMEQKRQSFYAACLADRKPYDCDMQWATFESSHNAEMAAALAVGITAGKR